MCERRRRRERQLRRLGQVDGDQQRDQVAGLQEHALRLRRRKQSRRVLNKNTRATNAYPCEYWRPAPYGAGATNLVCVAATGKLDTLAGFSNRGKSAVHLAAPGVDIYSSLPQWSSVFSDDLEANFNNWTRRRAAQTRRGSGRDELSESGTFSMTDSPGGNYANRPELHDPQQRRPEPDGPDGLPRGLQPRAADARLQQHRNVFDWFAIERATGTAGPWTEIAFYFGSTQGDFAAVTDDLSSLDGLGTGYIRFLVHTDNTVVDGGAHVDDVVVKCLQPNGEDYESFAGTSMATPHVAGAAALLLAAEPAMTPQKLKNALLKGVDKKTALTKHVSSGGRLNLNNSLNIAMDHIAPETTIIQRPPASTTNRRATFRFVSNEPGSTFRCRHMYGPWVACSSPKLYSGLAPGMHRFAVRAIDKNGNVDPTPATDTWRIRR